MGIRDKFQKPAHPTIAWLDVEPARLGDVSATGMKVVPPKLSCILDHWNGSWFIEDHLDPINHVWPLTPDGQYDRNHRIDSFEAHAQSLHEHGHEFCALVPEEWTCASEEYFKFLDNEERKSAKNQTTLNFLFRNNDSSSSDSSGGGSGGGSKRGSGSPTKLRKGSIIFIDGNDWAQAQIMYSYICQKGMKIWKLEASRHKIVTGYPYSMSVLAYDNKDDILILMMDKDSVFDRKMSWWGDILSTLTRQCSFIPDVVVLGGGSSSRDTKTENEEYRISTASDLWEEAALVPLFDVAAIQPKMCSATDGDCSSRGGVQCYPGPAQKISQIVWNFLGVLTHNGGKDQIQQHRYNITNSSRNVVLPPTISAYLLERCSSEK